MILDDLIVPKSNWRSLVLAKILREYSLGNDESLVLINMTRPDKTTQKYVSVVRHLPNRPLIWSCAEYVTDIAVDNVWRQRTMFSGRNARSLAVPKNETVLRTQEITIDKS